MKKSILGLVIGILCVGLVSSQCYATRVNRKFSSEEDMMLKQLVEQHVKIGWTKISWTKIASFMGNKRHPRQYRDRWKYCLSNAYDNSPFLEWEDKLILEQAEKLGHKWALIAKMLVNRSDLQVKNRFYQMKRSSVRITNPQMSMMPRIVMPEVNIDDKKEDPKLDELVVDKLDFDDVIRNDGFYIDGQCFGDGQEWNE